MWTRSELKTRAKAVLQKYYWLCVVVCLVLAVVGGTGSSGSGFNTSSIKDNTDQILTDNSYDDYDSDYSTEDDGSIVGGILIAGVAVGILAIVLVIIAIGAVFGTFVSNPIIVGANRTFMHTREDRGKFEEIFFVFTSGKYLNVVKIMFLMNLKIFLWSLLFFIPGIIKSYEYRMIPYILSENPGIDSKRAFELSKKMTDGQKCDIWVLDLSFIGWDFLTLCCFVGTLWVNPYKQTTYAELYAVLRNNALQSGYTHTGELGDYYYNNVNQATYAANNSNFYYGSYGDASGNYGAYQNGADQITHTGSVNLNKDNQNNDGYTQQW